MTTQAKKQKRLKLYSAYAFGRDEKDPVIDRIHTMLEDEGLSYGKAAEISGLSYATIYNWVEGSTRRPQYCTVAALAGSLGYEMNWKKKHHGNVNNVVALHRKRKAA